MSTKGNIAITILAVSLKISEMIAVLDSTLSSSGSLTMMFARRKLSPVPRLFIIWLMEVAVTLSLGGNQAADTAGGAEVTTMLGTPLSKAPRWHSRVKSDSESSGTTRKTHRTEVPRAIRLLLRRTEYLTAKT